jgi:hypothetical protein
MHRKPRSTQRPKHSDADGHLPRSPTGHNPHRPGATPELLSPHPSADNSTPHFGPREGHVKQRLTNITVERARTTASPMARRLTKFTTNMHGQVKIPHNLISPDRETSGDTADSMRCLDVGQVPED